MHYRPRRQDRPALANVSFSIQSGAFTVVLGPSGAGKSTLLRLMLAMERPNKGTIRIAGRDIHRLRNASIPYLRRNVGAIFQDFKLLPAATALDNVALALRVLGLPATTIRRRAEQALDQVALSQATHRPVNCLSGGEQQRVAIARALACEPALLLADEPTGNLDARLSQDILDLLTQVCARGTTVILATHDPVVCEHAPVTQRLHLQRGRLMHDSWEEGAMRFPKLFGHVPFDEQVTTPVEAVA